MGSLVGTFFNDIIIYPIAAIVELMYVFFMKALGVEGLAIFGVSIAVSFLTLPLYHAAEHLQQKERALRKTMQPGVDRIRAVFKGDERYMMLSTLYRQNHYHPMYALRNSLNLLIQIPFFIAAYHFLSHLDALNGVSFLVMNDLGSPDGYLKIGGFSINVLPLLMTLINVVSGTIYSQGFPRRDKIQIYGIALIFLVLLYRSPSALVFYWTLNNIFSLGKNLFIKLRHPLRVLYALAAAGSVFAAGFIIVQNPSITLVKIVFVILLSAAVISIPFMLRFFNFLYRRILSVLEETPKQTFHLFTSSCLLLWILHGILIPSNLIASSVQEFALIDPTGHPLRLIVDTALKFGGIFLFWPLILYRLAAKKLRIGGAVFLFLLSLSSLLNVFVFSSSYGVIDALLVFENPGLLKGSMLTSLLSFTIILGLFLAALFLIRRKRVANIVHILIILLAAEGVAAGFSIWNIQEEYKEYTNIQAVQEGSELTGIPDPVIHLSKEGKNVVILMLDRSISSYFPLIIEQFSELADQYAGFTYYPNTVSFGSGTLTGSPALMGGYEYTPRAINERVDEALVDKHNEAMLVLPRIFSDAGYSVLVTDPPLSNYAWVGDFTPFLSYPEIEVKHQLGLYSRAYIAEHQADFDTQQASAALLSERFPVFTLMMSASPFIREEIYDKGNYLSAQSVSSNFDEFLASYAELYYLREMTSADGEGDTYTFIDNETTHQPMFLSFPEVYPTSYLKEIYNPFAGVEGINDRDIGTYHVNAASLKRIALWLDRLRQEGVYDNTRIIIVADHGRDVYIPAFAEFEKNSRTYGDYNPLLLFKDFGDTHELTTDRRFMTNADTPLLALENLPISPVNPFTGKNLVEETDKSEPTVVKGPWAPPKTGHLIEIVEERSFRVKDNIFIEANWRPITSEENR